MLEFLCKKSVRSSCVSFVYFARAIIAVAVVSLIRIVQEGELDADLLTRKRYIQLVNLINEHVPQKVNKKK